MHFFAPSHPLVYAFLLQKEAFSDTRKVIVENQEQGEGLLEALRALQVTQNRKHKTENTNFRLISSLVDIAEFEHDTSIIGIFTPETLDWKIDPKHIENYYFKLEKGMKCTEDTLIHWLSEHGYSAKKSDEIGTYFRVGDTISLPVQQGVLRISFFGGVMEEIFLGETTQKSVYIYSQAGGEV